MLGRGECQTVNDGANQTENIEANSTVCTIAIVCRVNTYRFRDGTTEDGHDTTGHIV